MRYWVYDEDGVLLRKFWSKEEAEKYGRVVVQPKQVKNKSTLPTAETYGEARW